MNREGLDSLAGRLLAHRRGERPPDPAEQEGVEALAERIAGSIRDGGRRGETGGWSRDRVVAELERVADEDTAVASLIARLLRPKAVPAGRHPRFAPIPGVDCELRIRQERSAEGTTLTIELVTAEPGFAPVRHRVRLLADPTAYAEEIFTALTQSGRGRTLEPGLAGVELSHKLLGSSRVAYRLWELAQDDRTLLLRSDEPSIPWELLRLQKPGGKLGPYLCEAFSLTRWFAGRLPPLRELPLRRMAVVASQQGDPQAGRGELSDLLRRDGATRSVQQVAARFVPLVEAMASGGYDGWHFCGHGLAARADPDSAALPLDDHHPFTVRHLYGEAAGCGRSRPLVFLNGCHTGRTGWSLTGVAGWAQRFLDVGAGAFIGTLWAVDGTAARSFAKTFYDCFCDDAAPFGTAVRQARQAARAAGDASWLAYTAYGHPLAACRPLPKLAGS